MALSKSKGDSKGQDRLLYDESLDSIQKRLNAKYGWAPWTSYQKPVRVRKNRETGEWEPVKRRST